MKTLEKIIHSGRKILAASLLATSLVLPYNSKAESLRITPEYNSQNIGLISEIIPMKLSRGNMANGAVDEKYSSETKNSTFYISGKIDKQKQVVYLALSTLKVPEELPINKPLTEIQKRMALETIFDEINLNRTKVYAIHSIGTEIGETTQSAIVIPGERLELKPLEETLIPRLGLKYGEKLVNTVMEVLPKFCTTLREEIEEREKARTDSKIRSEKDEIDSALQTTKIPLYPKDKKIIGKPEVRRVIEIPYKVSSGDQLYIAIDLCTGLNRPNEYKGELETIIEIEKGSETGSIKNNEGNIYGEWEIIDLDRGKKQNCIINMNEIFIGLKIKATDKIDTATIEIDGQELIWTKKNRDIYFYRENSDGWVKGIAIRKNSNARIPNEIINEVNKMYNVWINDPMFPLSNRRGLALQKEEIDKWIENQNGDPQKKGN